MRRLTFLLMLSFSSTLFAQSKDPLTVPTEQGPVHGFVTPVGTRAFLGIPYAAPPIGPLRWQAPQASTPRKGPAFEADHFGHRCIQFVNYGDMVFRDPGQSEDCLSLNIWVPAAKADKPLPVMIWIYGGGFVGGATSEARQDGQFLAQRGVIVVSMNYRLGLLGFLTHPVLTAESPHHASGNYGLMDQAAAIAWVHRNIAKFGGDPANITLFGESAGAFSVSSQMASPLSKDLLAKAIGESGGAFYKSSLVFEPRAVREPRDMATLRANLGTDDVAALRQLPVEALLKPKAFSSSKLFPPCIDGYFLPDTLGNLFAAGKQAHIPLLAGWNADEVRLGAIRAKPPITSASFRAKAHTDFGSDADRFLAVYPARNDTEALTSAGDYAGDLFLVYSTWRWLEAQAQTGGKPVYRYLLDLVPPADKFHPAGSGAFHSDDIEYVFGTLDSRQQATWRPEDRTLSNHIMAYWTNFARTGNPNGDAAAGDSLPIWRTYNAADHWQVMHLDSPPAARPDTQRARYLFLDSVWGK
jgi:para-nitrobenzyl esterase